MLSDRLPGPNPYKLTSNFGSIPNASSISIRRKTGIRPCSSVVEHKISILEKSKQLLNSGCKQPNPSELTSIMRRFDSFQGL